MATVLSVIKHVCERYASSHVEPQYVARMHMKPWHGFLDYLTELHGLCGYHVKFMQPGNERGFWLSWWFLPTTAITDSLFLMKLQAPPGIHQAVIFTTPYMLQSPTTYRLALGKSSVLVAYTSGLKQCDGWLVYTLLVLLFPVTNLTVQLYRQTFTSCKSPLIYMNIVCAVWHPMVFTYNSATWPWAPYLNPCTLPNSRFWFHFSSSPLLFIPLDKLM